MRHVVGVLLLLGLLLLHDGIAQILKRSCVYPNECVRLNRCKNRATSLNGRNYVNFRTLLLGNDGCSSLDVCCSPENRSTEPVLVSHEINTKCLNCGCSNPEGVDDVTGQEAEHISQIGEFPWVVRILETPSMKLLASGSLITPSVVLTKAHHIVDMLPHNLQVVAGDWDTKSESERYTHEQMGVVKIEAHSEFSVINTAYNAALLILENAFEMKPNIRNICLANGRRNTNVNNCIVSGWGKNKFDDLDYMDIQRKITLPLLDNIYCQNLMRRYRMVPSNFRIPESVLCAGGEADEDACTGDGGGPLFCPIPNQPHRYEQVGIVNWGYECGHKNFPALYTNVSFIRPWIDKTLSKYSVSPMIYTAPRKH